MVEQVRNALNETTVRETLTAIHELCELVGHPATVRDVAVWADQPLGTMHGWLNRLRKRGLVERSAAARSLRLTPAGRRHIGLPKVITLSDFGPNPVVRLYG